MALLQNLIVSFLLMNIVYAHQKIDLAFLVDTSKNIGQNNLKVALDFIPKYLEYYSISRSNTRVSLVTFASISKTKFLFQSYGNRRCALRKLKEIKTRTRASGSSKGFLPAVDPLLKSFLHHKRVNSKGIIVIVVGAATFSSITTRNAKFISRKFQTKNISLRTIFIGKEHNADAFTLRLLNGIFLANENFIGTVLKKIFHGRINYTKCKGKGFVYDECRRRCKCSGGTLKDCFRVRKEFSRFSRREKQRYIRAFKSVSTSKLFKKRYEAIAIVHKKYFWRGIHSKSQFLPWHRWYILQMENLLREIDCRVTIPFWDWSYWSKSAWSKNAHIWREDSLGHNGDPLKDFCVENGAFRRTNWKTPLYENSSLMYSLAVRAAKTGLLCKALHPHPRCVRRWFNGRPPSFEFVNKVVQLPLRRFSDFEILVRDSFHNRLHCAIGGTMCTADASSTPEFWFHHAMLDYLWYRWQQRGHPYRNAYFGNNDSKLIAYQTMSRDLIDARNLPGCVSVVYEIFHQNEVYVEEGSSLVYDDKRSNVDEQNARQRRLLFRLSKREAKRVDHLEKELFIAEKKFGPSFREDTISVGSFHIK